VDFETLGTLPLKLGWDRRRVGVRAPRHLTHMSISRWQASLVAIVKA